MSDKNKSNQGGNKNTPPPVVKKSDIGVRREVKPFAAEIPLPPKTKTKTKK